MNTPEELYLGPDRGEFLVARMVNAEGLFTDVNCRIRSASVFNFASEHSYALVGYQIEYWPAGEKAPYEEGGQPALLYRPQGRPDYNTFYMRMKVSSVVKMLYLEDGIINDFINSKVLADVITLENYTKAAQQQTQSIATPRRVQRTDVEYRNAFHVTRYASSAEAPLAVTEQWLQYQANIHNTPADDKIYSIKDKPFVSLRDMVNSIVADFTAQPK